MCSYKLFTLLARHLYSQHSYNDVVMGLEPSDVVDDSDSVAPGDNAVSSADVDSQPTDAAHRFDSSHATAVFIASLMSSSSVTQRTIQSVIEHTSRLVTQTVDSMTHDVITTLRFANAVANERC